MRRRFTVRVTVWSTVRSTVRIVGALAVAALAAAADAEDGPDAFPSESPLSEVTIEREHRRNYPLRGGRRPAGAPPVRQAVVGETRVLFVDVDGNGRYGDAGIDGWTLPGAAYRYVVPVEPSIVLGARRVWLRFANDGSKVAFREEPFAIPAASSKERKQAKAGLGALLVWNDLRLRHGLVPARLDPELSADCVRHARYCVRHGITHKQAKANEGYTAGGAEAGRYGGIGEAEPAVEIDLSHRAFFHRMQLVHATTERVGIGYAGGITVIDGSRGRGRRKWTYPVCIPAPDTTGHPRAFSREQPTPHPRELGNSGGRGVGCPITLTFERDGVTDVTAKLRLDGPEGKPVDVLVSSPDAPGHTSIPDNYKTIGIIPRKQLKSRARYWVHVTYVDRGKPGERTWTFETGR